MATNPLEKLVKSVREYLINSSGGGRAPAVCRDNLVGALAVYDYAGELAEYDTQAQKTLDLVDKALTPPEDELREEYRLACLRIESNERALSEMTEADIAARKVIEDLRGQLAEANGALADMEGRVDEFADQHRVDRDYIVQLEQKVARLETQTKHVPDGYELVPEARASAYRSVAIHAERLRRSGFSAAMWAGLDGALDALNATLPGRGEA